MKKLLALITAIICITICSDNLIYADSVNVTIPEFNVSLNNLQLDVDKTKYPVLLYKDITYVPMAYYYADCLGLRTDWANNTLSIEQKSVIDSNRDYQNWYKTDTANKRNYSAQILQFTIIINGKKLDNKQSEYPLLLFRDVTYFPLTWDYVVNEFGWGHEFSRANGLKIYVNRRYTSPHNYEPKYIMKDDFKLSYPASTFGDIPLCSYQKANGKKTEFRLEKLVTDGNYYFGTLRDTNGYMNSSAEDATPRVEDDVLYLPCVRIKNNDKNNFLLKVDLIKGELISKEELPLLKVE